MKHTHSLKEFAKYVSLNVMGMLGLSFYILADTFFISRGLGAGGLTALNLAIPVYSVIHGCGLMLGMGGATKYSIYKGQKMFKDTNALFTNTLYLTLMLAVICLLAGLFLSPRLTSLLGADPEVFAMTETYLKVILLFAPAFMLNEVFLCFVRNDGGPRLSMLAMLGGSLSNIVLDYIFIFPLGMGIFGVVLATGLAPLISMLILFRHLLKKKNGFHLERVRLQPPIAGAVFSLGFPSLVSEVAAGIVIIVFNMLLLKLLGNVGVAAYGVIANLSLVVMAVYTGMAQGIQPLISKAYGSGRPADIRWIFRCALCTMLVFSTVIFLAISLFAAPITSLFNNENNLELQAIAETGLRLYFTSVVFAGFNILLSVYFTSTERVAPAQVLSLMRGLFLIVPAAFLLAALMGVTGVWLAFPLTEAVTAAAGGMLYLIVNKK